MPVSHKDADTPEELTRWIWDKYVGVPVAGDAWGQEYEHLLNRVRRMDRSSFTKGLHEGADQMKALASHAPSEAAASEARQMYEHLWPGRLEQIESEAAAQQRCPICGSYSRSQILCQMRHQDKPYDLPHVAQLVECRSCEHDWHKAEIEHNDH